MEDDESEKLSTDSSGSLTDELGSDYEKNWEPGAPRKNMINSAVKTFVGESLKSLTDLTSLFIGEKMM